MFTLKVKGFVVKKREKKLVLKWKKALRKGKRPKFKSFYERMLWTFLFQEGVFQSKKVFVSHLDEIVEELCNK